MDLQFGFWSCLLVNKVVLSQSMIKYGKGGHALVPWMSNSPSCGWYMKHHLQSESWLHRNDHSLLQHIEELHPPLLDTWEAEHTSNVHMSPDLNLVTFVRNHQKQMLAHVLCLCFEPSYTVLTQDTDCIDLGVQGWSMGLTFFVLEMLKIYTSRCHCVFTSVANDCWTISAGKPFVAWVQRLGVLFARVTWRIHLSW